MPLDEKTLLSGLKLLPKGSGFETITTERDLRRKSAYKVSVAPLSLFEVQGGIKTAVSEGLVEFPKQVTRVVKAIQSSGPAAVDLKPYLTQLWYLLYYGSQKLHSMAQDPNVTPEEIGLTFGLLRDGVDETGESKFEDLSGNTHRFPRAIQGWDEEDPDGLSISAAIQQNVPEHHKTFDDIFSTAIPGKNRKDAVVQAKKLQLERGINTEQKLWDELPGAKP